MKKTILLLVSLIFITSSCTAAKAQTKINEDGTESQCQVIVSTPTEQLESGLFGMWKNSEDEVIVFSESNVYIVERHQALPTGMTQVYEDFYEIDSIDWVTGVITLNYSRRYVGGYLRSWNSAQRYLRVSINGSSLMYSINDIEQGIPEETTIGPFSKQ